MADEIVGEDAVLAALHEHTKLRGGTKRLADILGISDAFVSRVSTGVAKPTETLARYLGFERITMYRRVKPEESTNVQD